jgi:thiol-disulfide isomerase/thioredoxin
MMRTLRILSAMFMLLCLVVGRPEASDRMRAYEWIGKKAPELEEGDWINSRPLTLESQRGRVILLEFWTYGCINCRNTLPFVKKWHTTYSGQDFRIIGVHTPEFESEKRLENVRRRTAELGIEYAVVTDNDYATWRSYHQRYWPVIYLIDKKGIIRYVHIGEGAYDTTEEIIQQLLAE